MTESRINWLIEKQEGLTDHSREALERMQLTKLNALLKKEKERGGYFSKLPESLGSLAELSSLPFCDDEALAEHAGGMLLVSQSEIQRVLSDATSGTTGKAKRVFYTEGDCKRTVELFMAGLGEFVFPGSVTMICMPFSGPYGLGELISEAIENLGAKAVKAGWGKSYGELKAIMDAEQPDTYVGMPTEFLAMLRVCGKGSLKRALVSGDACPDTVITEAEAILGTPLWPHYGSREMALGGAICCPAHEGMHLRENHVIAEIVDEEGKVLPHGKFGELVITTIGMEALPLIRYRTGDYTRIIPGKCRCGSELIRLDSVRRKGEAGEMAALDEKLYSLGALVDYKISRICGGYSLEGLYKGWLDPRQITELCPEIVAVKLREVSMDDRPMYKGKRRIE
ncbi:MAG: AMP-binding protein [Clostridia bacterium]|nr:AMP-binding protein [Clostridia bacterium]